MTDRAQKDPLVLGYVGINAKNVDAWAPFCTDLLGMAIGEPSPAGAQRFKMDQRAYRLAVESSEQDGFAYAGWEVRSLDALSRVADAVARTGVAITEADAELLEERALSAMVHFVDPSGVRCEIYTGQRIEEATKFQSPTGVNFVVDDMGLGHVNFVVDNYNDTLDFYVNTLGFQISDYRPASRGWPVAFLSCDPRHHSYGIVDSGNTGTMLDHLMFEVDDLADVGRCYDKVWDGVAPLSLTLGKHWNDMMTSFYMEAPSGFDIEYGFGGRRIDRDTWTTVQFNSACIWGHRVASENAAKRVQARDWINMKEVMGRGIWC